MYAAERRATAAGRAGGQQGGRQEGRQGGRQGGRSEACCGGGWARRDGERHDELARRHRDGRKGGLWEGDPQRLVAVGGGIEGHRAAEQDVGDHAHAPQVHRRVVRGLRAAAAELLRRGVAERAARRRGCAQPRGRGGAHALARTEVGHLDGGVGVGRGEQQVLGLEVAVQHAARVHVLHRAEHLVHLPRRLRLVEAPLRIHDPLEEFAAWRPLDQEDVLRGVEQVAVASDDVRVAQRPPDLLLLLELHSRPRREVGQCGHLGHELAGLLLRSV
eukprot:scaffold24197_cov63-Phaeocystis_antarctica.AAC.5